MKTVDKKRNKPVYQ